MAKKVAFFNETDADILVSYVYDGTTTVTTVGVAVNSLPSAPTMYVPYFQDTDPDSIIDACAVIPTANTATATFQRSDLSTYPIGSVDFLGPHPPHRPT